MEWFKHMTGSNEDRDISDAWDRFGDPAYVIFFIVLEIYGREFNRLNKDGFLTVQRRYLQRKTRKKWKTIENVIGFYQECNRFLFFENQNGVHIKIPKFIELSSNWTKRKDSRPTEAPTEAPTAIELEEEVEEEKKNINLVKAQPFRLPSPEEIENFSLPKLKETTNAICKELYERDIFPKANAFANKAKKSNANARAILHTLCRIFNAKPSKPWGYALKILKVEDGNFCEKDFRKAT